MHNIKRMATVLLSVISLTLYAQNRTGIQNDSNTPLHALKPDYKVPYAGMTPEKVKHTLDRVYHYLNEVTPPNIVNATTGEVIANFRKPEKEAILQQGDFRLTSYEWGVTYTGMILAGDNTNDSRYTGYTISRMNFLAQAAKYFSAFGKEFKDTPNPLRHVLRPQALDDAGSICASMIKAYRKGLIPEARPLIDNYMDYIMNKEFRLKDGTLARNRPLPNTLWLDDLYMSLPAIVQMGALTGDPGYFDESVRQLRLFSERMFNKDKGVYMHGWVEGMEPHPEFHWARANGWALMTKVELLEALPDNHSGKPFVLRLLRDHIAGLAKYQSGDGFWHQLIDRNDSYLETSATAIYAYCIAQSINHGWINLQAYGPMAILAWNAVSTKVNEKGQVEGTCVGTGMAFDPAFYYYRPVNVYAAHGYGPVLLAGAAVFRLLKEHPAEINDSALMTPR